MHVLLRSPLLWKTTCLRGIGSPRIHFWPIYFSKWFTYQRGFPLMNDEAWKKWMNNDICELIMLSKTTMIAKLELLTMVLLFWNSGTNTFDFRMGPMSSTILDMAQVGDAFVLQEAEAEVARQGVGKGRDVSELFGDSKGEGEPEVEVQATRQTRALVIESSDSNSQEQPKSWPVLPIPRATLGQGHRLPMLRKLHLLLPLLYSTSIPSTSPPLVVAYGEGSGIISPSPISKDDPLHQPRETTHPPPFSKDSPHSTPLPILLGRPFMKTARTKIDASSSVETTSTITPFEGAGALPPSPALISTTTSLPELFKEFWQLKIKLRSSKALRDQHQRAKRQANRVKCFKVKQSSTLANIQQLVDEGSATKEMIKVVTFEIQKLKEQLAALKAEQTTLLSKLHQQTEEVKKANLEMKDAESQLASSNTVLAEPTRMFTIMQTYHSRIITLGEDVTLLG
ncbi:TMV resistance protein N-like [Pyrus ussuriensis x Pyrus communis]|uniref:TMV resistance protein N-like n=1 Tax=Pyrus ussuriensis x Pyrus communis TaxID=2448454 RepID=A0A5N5G1F2_9ROSA|nr:TMV resistance protein N-like [Pyrus ussuriensis x Pyrus communis]KAB2608947.1 TMV resistance protein N-like [Pyrus ussuriensis x Pyrus communis]